MKDFNIVENKAAVAGQELHRLVRAVVGESRVAVGSTEVARTIAGDLIGPIAHAQIGPVAEHRSVARQALYCCACEAELPYKKRPFARITQAEQKRAVGGVTFLVEIERGRRRPSGVRVATEQPA